MSEKVVSKFPFKPKRVPMTTNYFKLNFTYGIKSTVFKYKVIFQPDIPTKNQKKKTYVFNKCRKQLNIDYGRVVYEGNNEFYSMINVDVVKEYKCTLGDDPFLMTIQFVQIINPEYPDAKVFYGVFMKNMFKKLGLREIGRKYFDVEASIGLSDVSIRVMPGFSSALENFKDGLMVNIDIAHRVLREDTAWEVIFKVNRDGRDTKRKVKGVMIGAVVMTRYNKNSTYTVKDVKFDMSPMSTFPYYDREKKVKTEISYADYYKEKYHIELKHLDQPMLEHYDKKQRRSIYLAPEICKMTGLTDDQRKNFRLMKEMATHTHKSAQNRMKEISKLFSLIKKCED